MMSRRSFVSALWNRQWKLAVVGWLALVLGVTGVAAAYLSDSGTQESGTIARADQVGEALTPTVLKVSPGANVVELTELGAPTLAMTGRPVDGYEVRRWAEPSGGTPSAEFVCGTDSCVESGVPDGTWYYSVRARFAEAWTGPESARSAALLVDATAPQVTGLVRLDADPTNAAAVSWRVSFSEPVVGVDAGDFAVVADGVTGATIESVTGSGTIYVVRVATGSGDGTLRLDLVDDDSIVDASVGNPLAGAAADGSLSGESYTIDRTAPAATIERDAGPATNAGRVYWTVEFDEPVTGLTSEGFATAAVGLSGTAVVDVLALDASRYRVEVDTGAGDGEVDLVLLAGAVTDAAGNANAEVVAARPYTVEKTGPVVTRLARVDPSPSSAVTLVWRLEFDRAVTGVDASDFELVATGTATGEVHAVGESAGGYDITVTGVTGSGTLQLVLHDDDTIRSLVGNPLGGPGLDNGAVGGDTYVVDHDAPVVSSIARQDPIAAGTNRSSVRFRATFSEPVTGVSTATFDLRVSGTSTDAAITSVSPVSSTVYDVTVATGSTEGTIGLDAVADAAVTDAVGFTLVSGFVGSSYTVDTIAPTVVTVDRVDTERTNASTVRWAVRFREPVSGVTAADFSLDGTGAADASISSVVANAGRDLWTVTATVGADGSLGVRLVDDDSIVDDLGNPLGGPGADNGGAEGGAYQIDRTAPTAVITRLSASPTNTATVAWTVTFSEPVRAPVAGDFALVTSGVTGAVITDVTAIDPTRATVTASTGAGDGTLRLDLPASRITDTAGNVNLAATGASITLDRSLPVVTVTSPADGSATRSTSLTLSGACTTGDGPVTVSLTGAGAPAVVPATCSSGSWSTGSVTFPEGSYQVVASQTDPAGNTGTSASRSFRIDLTAPRLAGITRENPAAEFTNASSVTFTVTFDEAVTGVVSSSFTTSGISGSGGAGNINGVAGSGTTWSVTVATGNNNVNGTLTLALASGASINDLAGNALTTREATGSVETYTIDKTAPRLSGITRHDPLGAATNRNQVTFRVTFSEPLAGIDTADFTVTGTSGGTVVTTSAATGDVIDIVVDTGAPDGTTILGLANTATLTDRAGNPMSTFTATGSVESYTIDRTAPAVTVTNPVAGSTATSSPLTVAGACANGDGAVTLTFTGTGAPSGQAVNCTSNAWSASVAFGTGSYTVQASQTDAAGNTGRSPVVSFSVTVTETVTFQSSSAAMTSPTSGAAATSITIARPAGVVAGELLLANVAYEKGTDAGTNAQLTPAGWTLLIRTDRSSAFGQAVFYRIATAADETTTSYTFPFSQANKAAGSILRYSGVDPTSPFGASSTGARGSGSAATAPTVDAPANSVLVTFWSIKKKDTSATLPASMTQRVAFENPQDVTLRVADEHRPNAGLTGTRRADFSQSGEWVANSVVLRAG
jgi:hypothetical protein